jgi:riboflavin kinase / FMN adenylyltransferase
MKIIDGSAAFKKLKITNCVITLGNFDGVHRGHQKIIRKAVERARAINGSAVVYTFDPHPLNVLRPEQEPPKITTFEEKAHLISLLGVDYMVREHFTRRFAQKTPEAFLQDVLYRRLQPREIVIGHDYSFGRGRNGSVALLQQAGEQHGFTVHVEPDIRDRSLPVRSTMIRTMIAEGRVSLAAKLLGTDYRMSGTVVHGKKRRIGFPTANLSHIKDLVPHNGVYAVLADTPYGTYGGVVNIGFNPTFDGTKRTIEAHLFDFNEDLYGRDITLRFVRKIRLERKFDSTEELRRQIGLDIDKARKILSGRAERLS